MKVSRDGETWRGKADSVQWLMASHLQEPVLDVLENVGEPATGHDRSLFAFCQRTWASAKFVNSLVLERGFEATSWSIFQAVPLSCYISECCGPEG